MKNGLLRAAALTLGVFAAAGLLIRFCGRLFAPSMGEYAAVFRQLESARITWSPLLPAGVFLLSFLRFRFGKKTALLTAPLLLLGFAAALAGMRVNGVPLPMAVRAALAILG